MLFLPYLHGVILSEKHEAATSRMPMLYASAPQPSLTHGMLKPCPNFLRHISAINEENLHLLDQDSQPLWTYIYTFTLFSIRRSSDRAFQNDD